VTRSVAADRSALPRRWLQEVVAAAGLGRPQLLPAGRGPRGYGGRAVSPCARDPRGAPLGNSLLSANRAVESQRDAVLRYLSANLSAPDIARELSVSVTTVRTRIRHLFVKLDAHRI
jgi:DNA-binding NarL/FixJ family response regulator